MNGSRPTSLRSLAATPGPKPPPLAQAVRLSSGYRDRAVIEEVTFDIAAGQRIALLGPNGGGKTTLLRTLLGELAPLQGSLRVAGRCGFVPQTERSRLDYPVSALDVALMGSLSRLPWWRRPGRSERVQALDALAAVGLSRMAKTTFGELSGGQRQRVLIARCLVQEAELLLLDEPFSGLDRDAAAQLEDLVGGLAAQGKGLIIATHDLEQARSFDYVLCLNRLQVAFGRPEQVLSLEVMEETYRGVVLGSVSEHPIANLAVHVHD